MEADRIYLKVGHRHLLIHLTGRHAAEIGDRYLNCTVIDAAEMPLGPPHYIDLTLEYAGTAEPVSVTAYEGQWGAVMSTYAVDPAVEPVFTIDGSQQPNGHIGENLVLEY